MVQKQINQLPKSVLEITITVPWSDLAPKWETNLQALANETELPGFRKGTAPLPMVENSMGQRVQEEFLKVVMPQALVEALQGENIVPIDYPKYQLVSFTKGSDLNFKAAITQRPTVTIGDYKTINVVRPAVKVITDEDVDKVIEDLFKRWKARNPSGSLTQTPPATSGGSVSFNAPANNPTPTPDAPNDQFALSLGAANLADLKLKIKTDLENEAKFNNELDYEEAILQQVEKLTSVEIPDILVEDELNRMLVNLQRRVADMGMLMDDYLRTQNPPTTVEGLRDKWREQAIKNVRMELGLAEIGRGEKVEITDADVQAEIDKIQDARLKQQFDAAEPRLQLRHNLRQMRTLDLLKKLVHPN